MKIPTKGRYAVSAMLDLALHDKIRPLTIAEIAEKQNISLSYLEQIFAVLRKNGLVRGMRGPGGGYRLAKTMNLITIAHIIQSVDEKSSKAKDDSAEEYLPYELWAELSKQIYSFLDGISLADCLTNQETKEKLENQFLIAENTAESVAA